MTCHAPRVNHRVKHTRRMCVFFTVQQLSVCVAVYPPWSDCGYTYVFFFSSREGTGETHLEGLQRAFAVSTTRFNILTAPVQVLLRRQSFSTEMRTILRQERRAGQSFGRRRARRRGEPPVGLRARGSVRFAFSSVHPESCQKTRQAGAPKASWLMYDRSRSAASAGRRQLAAAIRGLSAALRTL